MTGPGGIAGAAPPGADGPQAVGARVLIVPLRLTGTVTAARADGYEVTAGELRVHCAAADLAPAPPAADPVTEVRVHWQAAAATQLELHGLTTAEAAVAVEAFLNRSFLAGAGLLRIVHGKGSGALQRWLDDYLAQHPLVAAFRRGWYGEGDNGVTVVTLQPRKG